jgi:hypothetical protein
MSLSIHQNLKNLSHSSCDVLHRCPREYQIYKIGSQIKSQGSIDTIFGSVVGIGVQLILLGETREQAIWKMFLAWKGDLLSTSDEVNVSKKRKHFWHAVAAIDNFLSIQGLVFKDWKVAEFKGKPAVELSFRVNFGNNFLFRGHVDVVLVNIKTNELMVLELKTTGDTTVLAAKYGNSQQGVGYGVILDTIAQQYDEHKSSYKVLYLVYKTKSTEWIPLPFAKTYLQRAQWIKQVLIDCEKIKLYEREDYYPMHGENCVRFFRQCDYYDICGMSNKHLFGDISQIPVAEDKREDGKPIEYVFDLNVLDLLEAQLGKN